MLALQALKDAADPKTAMQTPAAPEDTTSAVDTSTSSPTTRTPEATGGSSCALCAAHAAALILRAVSIQLLNNKAAPFTRMSTLLPGSALSDVPVTNLDPLGPNTNLCTQLMTERWVFTEQAC